MGRNGQPHLWEGGTSQCQLTLETQQYLAKKLGIWEGFIILLHWLIHTMLEGDPWTQWFPFKRSSKMASLLKRQLSPSQHPSKSAVCCRARWNRCSQVLLKFTRLFVFQLLLSLNTDCAGHAASVGSAQTHHLAWAPLTKPNNIQDTRHCPEQHSFERQSPPLFHCTLLL